MVTAFEYVEDCNRKVLNYGWIEFPLAYTQVRGRMLRMERVDAGGHLLCLRLLHRRPLWSSVP